MRTLLVGAFTCAIASVASAQAPTISKPATLSSSRVYTHALGIALEEWNYPFPVHFFEWEVVGQRVRMAYMDIAPTTIKANKTTQTPVLLLHGKNFNGAYWSDTITALRNAGHRVIVPDQIGFGKSGKPDVAYSFDLLSQNTIALLNRLHLSKVVVVGHSMGGMLAVHLTRNHPERVQKLVLENPIGLEDYRSIVNPVSLERLYADELADTDVNKIRAFYKRYFVKWKPEYERFIELEARVTLSGEWPRWAKASARTYQMILQQPTMYDLPHIKVPTLLVIGQSDRTVVGRPYATPQKLQGAGNYPLLGRKTAKTIPNAKLVELPDVGHIPHIEAPQKFQSALLKFLKE